MNQNIQTKSRSWWQVSPLERLAALRQRESQVFLILSLVIGAVTGLVVGFGVSRWLWLAAVFCAVEPRPFRRDRRRVVGCGDGLYRDAADATGAAEADTCAIAGRGGRGLSV